LSNVYANATLGTATATGTIINDDDDDDDKTWVGAEPIGADNAGGAFLPQIAVDSSGNAIAVWYQHDGTRFNIYANRYVPGEGWGTAEPIGADNAGNAYVPQIAFDSSGNAIAVWAQSDGTRNNIWANRYDSGTGAWGTAELIETDDGNANSAQIAFDSSGNAIAVWDQYDGTRNNIWANRYDSVTGAWGTAELIRADNAGYAVGPQIAVDSSGNSIAVWHQHDGTKRYIYANRYVPGEGWGTAELLETDNAGFAYAHPPQIAVDSSGNAIAVWERWEGTRGSIWANRYVPGTGWGTAELIETDDTPSANSPQIAVDSSGNAIAVWMQWDGGTHDIWANRYDPVTGWGTAELIETDDTVNAYYPQIAVDSSGNAIAVWEQYGGRRSNIYANRYDSVTGAWGTAELIETDDGHADSPQIAVDSLGNAIAVWEQYDGTRDNIWANRFE